MTAPAIDTRVYDAWTVTAPAYLREANALLSLSQTQRRLSHRYSRQAAESEAAGNRPRYAYEIAEARRLWREAKLHLRHARERFDVVSLSNVDV